MVRHKFLSQKGSRSKPKKEVDPAEVTENRPRCAPATCSKFTTNVHIDFFEKRDGFGARARRWEGLDARANISTNPSQTLPE